MEYSFKHALAQEATYESILLQKRRELHALAGQAIETLFQDHLEQFYGLLAHQAWGLRVAAIALGMLLYCSIYSIGVFGQAGNRPATAFFVAIALLTLLFSGWLGLRNTPAPG